MTARASVRTDKAFESPSLLPPSSSLPRAVRAACLPLTDRLLIHVAVSLDDRHDALRGADTGKESDKYVGEWKEDKMHGQGRYTYSVSGDVYAGGWHDGLFHGYGKYTSADGAVYEGEYEAGERKGPIVA